MKLETEFQSFVLTKAIAAKAALAAEGKTPEEIATTLGESHKFDEKKTKFFVAALDVAAQNATNLRRVLVVGLAEGEAAPAKAVKVEEHYYVPEFLVTARPVQADAGDRKGGGRGGKGRGAGAPKSSPWGLSPEEKAAKNKGAAKA